MIVDGRVQPLMLAVRPIEIQLHGGLGGYLTAVLGVGAYWACTKAESEHLAGVRILMFKGRVIRAFSATRYRLLRRQRR